jgi:hypothetical protein
VGRRVFARPCCAPRPSRKRKTCQLPLLCSYKRYQGACQHESKSESEVRRAKKRHQPTSNRRSPATATGHRVTVSHRPPGAPGAGSPGVPGAGSRSRESPGGRETGEGRERAERESRESREIRERERERKRERKREKEREREKLECYRLALGARSPVLMLSDMYQGTFAKKKSGPRTPRPPPRPPGHRALCT